MGKVQKGLGKRVRALRRLKALTQEELGEKAGLSYKFIGEIERGEVNPSLDSLIKITDALGVKLGELFPGDADIFPQFSPHDLRLIKKALRLLNRTFSKISA